jgi:hypothetical protein
MTDTPTRAEAEARLTELVARWRTDVATYPVETEAGYFAATVLRLCAAELEALLPAIYGPKPETPTCAWTQDESDAWNTACGNIFEFNDGTPTENNQTFCGYCGLKLREVRYVDAPWETA